MFRAFIDETGNDPKEPVFCFAGWIARVDEWERFSDAWEKALRRSPSIGYFSHNEAVGLKYQFAGWKAADRDKKMLSLARTITKFDIKYGFTTGIRNDVVKKFMKAALPSIKTVRTILHVSRAYDWAFHSVVSMVLQLQVDFKQTEVVDFIFDKGDTAALEDCRRTYQEFRPFLPPARRDIAGEIIPGDDKKLMPLQAADLLVGASTVRLRDQGIGKAYQWLQSKKNIYFSPINKYQTPFANISELISLMNIQWASMLIEKAKEKK